MAEEIKEYFVAAEEKDSEKEVSKEFENESFATEGYEKSDIVENSEEDEEYFEKKEVFNDKQQGQSDGNDRPRYRRRNDSSKTGMFSHMKFKKRYCRFCKGEIKEISYKDVDILKRFISDRGKILPRRITGNCAKHQRRLARAVKQARILALLPFVSG